MNNSLVMVLVLSGPSLLIAMVLAFLLIKRKAQDRSGVERLLAVVKSAELEYRNSIQQRLTEKLKLDGGRAGLETDKLVKQRRQYFKQLLSALLNRDPAALTQIEPALRQFGESYLQLLGDLPAGSASATTGAAVIESLIPAAPPSDASEMQWRMENDRLRREVSMTLSTLNNIFAEYASMFGDENTRRDMNLEEILSSMQKLAEGEQSAPVDLAGNAPLASLEAQEMSAVPETEISDLGEGDVPASALSDETPTEQDAPVGPVGLVEPETEADAAIQKP